MWVWCIAGKCTRVFRLQVWSGEGNSKVTLEPNQASPEARVRVPMNLLLEYAALCHARVPQFELHFQTPSKTPELETDTLEQNICCFTL